MTALRYVLQSVLHYRLAYLGVLAGAVLGATVLLGALFAGDSVAASLRAIGEKRIGRATHLLASGDRFFREALAEDLGGKTGVRVAPVLIARGTATNSATRASANQVQLVGVTPAFWQLAPQPSGGPLTGAKSEAAINDTLARRLQIAVGDTMVVRVQKPGILSGNAPIAGAESKLETLRVKITAIVGDSSFGRFNLEATQVAPPSVFLPISSLQEAFNRPARANLLLLDGAKPDTALADALRQVLRLADYGLGLKWREKASAFEVSSDRVFIDPGMVEAIKKGAPTAQPVVSYLVNELRLGERTTPYSIAAATSALAAPFLSADLGPRDVVLNQWLADDLGAKMGDEVTATYFQVDAAEALIEKQAKFRVHAVIPLEGLAADTAWMADFPGISDTKNQSDWDPGLPLDLKRIRPHDEKYWDEYRGAPKAFFSLEAGREMWTTRWGSLTGLRIAQPIGASGQEDLERSLLTTLRPEMNQLLLRNVRAQAQDAAQSAVDFGGLFLGMSFFLILAALGLVAMLFQLSLLQRNREDALLGAVGLAPEKLLRWRLAEGTTILLFGAVLGVPLASLYTRGILRFLETIWAGQGAGATFTFAAQPMTIFVGVFVFLACSLIALWLAIRSQTRRVLSVRLAASSEATADPVKVRRTSQFIAVFSGLVGLGALASSGRGLPAQGAFYIAGFASLVAGLSWCRAWLARPLGHAASTVALNAAALGALNLKARRSRNLTVVGLIATAVFMVLSVASFRKHVGADWLNPGSGTGGFAFWAETTVAQNFPRDGTTKGFEIFSRQAAELGEIVPLRIGAGDNVNCFNLNTTLQPRLLGVDAGSLSRRKAFGVTAGMDWSALRQPTTTGALPAFVDQTTMMWALKRKVGDILTYTDENGRAFEVQLMAALPDSLFQGHLIVDEGLFLKKFPSNPGYALFLVDAKNPSADLVDLRNRLSTSAADSGGRVELTRDVLAAFHQIENTYIAIFNVLGTLGVVLGSLGLAIVIARNLQERRGEFAVLTAIGLPRDVLAKMVFSEFSQLVFRGLAIGAVASLVAIWPSLNALPAAPTLAIVAAMLVGIVALNLTCGWFIFRWSVRDLRPGLG